MPAAHHFRTGAARASAPGATIRCLVLAPGPDWVVADVATGALMRRFAGGTDGRGDDVLGPTLSAVELVLAEPDEPADPARPEAVQLAAPPVALAAPRRRAVRHLLDHLAANAPAQPLLGTLGPSVAYRDLDGSRPSVALVEPDRLPRFGNGPTGPYCQFSLGDRRHALPLIGRPDAVFAGTPDWSHAPRGSSGSRRRRAKAFAAVGAQMPRWLVVAFGEPWRGQVPKVVLGAVADPRSTRSR